jgi:hypothetical protein
MSRSALIVAALLALPAAPARAEEPLQAANGAVLYLGALEGVLLVEAPFALAAAGDLDLSSVLLCAAVAPLCALLAPALMQDTGAALGGLLLASLAVLAVPPTIAGVGGPDGWDVDGSLVLMTGVHTLLQGAMISGAVEVFSGGEGAAGAVVGGLVLGAAGTTYAALRHQELGHDPRVGDEAHALLWSPPLAMLAAGVIAAIADLDGGVAAFLSGLLGLTAQALSIGLAEAALAAPAEPTMGP